jgi:hypothetical protein
MLDEMLLAGELQEPSKKAVTRVIEVQVCCRLPSSAEDRALHVEKCSPPSAVWRCSVLRKHYTVLIGWGPTPAGSAGGGSQAGRPRHVRWAGRFGDGANPLLVGCTVPHCSFCSSS